MMLRALRNRRAGRPLSAFYEGAIAIARSSLIGMWPLNESTGTTANDRSGNARHAAYSGTVTLNATGLGDGQGVCSVAGSGAVNIYTAGLSGAWSGNEYTIHGWFKVSAAGDWSDATVRNLLTIGADGSNITYVRKSATANTLTMVRAAAGASLAISFAAGPDTGWIHIAVTASRADDVLRFYVNGVQVGSQLTGLAAWAGAPASTLCMVGASSSSRAAPWLGSYSNVGIHTAALTPIEVARLARCAGHILFDGDSRMVGSNSPTPEQTMQVTALKAKHYGFTRLAVSGQTWADMNADIATQAAANYRDYWRNIAIGWAGVNDAAAGASAATIWSRMQTWAAAARAAGFKVILATEIDGQNVALESVSWHSSLYPALNTLIRAGWSSCADGLADLGAVATLQDATNVTYFNADKLHLTTTGYGVAAGVIAAAAAAL